METLRTIISKIMDVPPNEINVESSPDTIESWDSFNGLMLVSELESNYSVKFSMDEIESVRNVGDIIRTLAKYDIIIDLDKNGM